MSNLNELFNKHSRVHPWAETDNKKTLDLEGLEAVIAEMMPSDEEIEAATRSGSQHRWNWSSMFKEGAYWFRSTLLGSDKNG
jgi:hypothetical protein